MPDRLNAFAELREEIDRSSTPHKFEREEAAAPPLGPAKEAPPPEDEQDFWTDAEIQPSLRGAFWAIITSMVLFTAFLIGAS